MQDMRDNMIHYHSTVYKVTVVNGVGTLEKAELTEHYFDSEESANKFIDELDGSTPKRITIEVVHTYKHVQPISSFTRVDESAPTIAERLNPLIEKLVKLHKAYGKLTTWQPPIVKETLEESIKTTQAEIDKILQENSAL